MLFTKDFWKNANKTMSGTIINIAAAFLTIAVPNTSRLDNEFLMAMSPGLEINKIFLVKNKGVTDVSVHCQQKAKRKTVVIIVLAFGMMTFKNVL